MKQSVGVMVVVLGMVGSCAWAQMPPEGDGMRQPQVPRGGPGRSGDPMMDEFFPPELVMQNQKLIDLKEDQQKTIREEMQKLMARFTDLQWRQSAAQETMMALVKQEHPATKEVMAELDKLLAIENEIKRLQFGMMLTIKNVLTAEQAAKLRELRRSPMPGRMGEGMPRMGDGAQRPGDGAARAGDVRAGEGRGGRADGGGERRGQPEDRPREAPPATR